MAVKIAENLCRRPLLSAARPAVLGWAPPQTVPFRYALACVHERSPLLFVRYLGYRDGGACA